VGVSFWYNGLMATRVYDSKTIETINGVAIYITPLKIKYLREFMDTFELLKTAQGQDEYMLFLAECVRIAMKQYMPTIQTIHDVEDNLDLETLYTVLEVAAGIELKKNSETEEKRVDKSSDSSWDTMKLAELESELFLLGIWKDYEELETSLSMPELTATLNAKRESDYNEKKFLAAIQGIDLDKQSNQRNEWEDMKARVFSKGQTSDSKDVLALQGVNAQKAGFGIGMGLEYEKLS
jgi:hypothetical protein